MTHLKTIPGFPAYCVTKDGRVWSRKTRRFLRPCSSHNGYFSVSIWSGPKAHSKRVNRLILETFIGPCPNGMECCHNNGIKTDNRLKNLRWDTRKNNRKDAIKHGVYSRLSEEKKGEANPAVVLKEKDVRIIIYMHRIGLFLQREIAKIYNVHQATISYIITKKNWKHIWSDSKAKSI